MRLNFSSSSFDILLMSSYQTLKCERRRSRRSRSFDWPHLGRKWGLSWIRTPWKFALRASNLHQSHTTTRSTAPTKTLLLSRPQPELTAHPAGDAEGRPTAIVAVFSLLPFSLRDFIIQHDSETRCTFLTLLVCWKSVLKESRFIFF